MLVAIRRSQGDSYATQLATKIDTTYAHSVKILQKFQDHEMVRTERKGRKKTYELTENGIAYADKLGEFLDVIGATPIDRSRNTTSGIAGSYA